MNNEVATDINVNRTKYCYRLGAFTVMVTSTAPISRGMTLCSAFRENAEQGWLVCLLADLNKYQIYLDLKMIRKLKYPSMYFVNCINDFMTIYDFNLKPFSDGVPARIQQEVVNQIMTDLNLMDIANE